MTNNYNNINNEEVQEIIGQIPPWIIRWGITVLFIVFLFCGICSYFIKIPDVLPAEVIISSKTQPFIINWNNTDPYIQKLLVKEGDSVNVGDTIIIRKSLIDSSIFPIKSAVKGKVILFNGNENDSNQSTMIVYPKISEYQTELYLSSSGIGKIRPDQRVLIKLKAYPEQDFGMLEGKIKSVLPVPLNGKHKILVILSEGLLTNKNLTIPPGHHLEGIAEIILEDKSLFRRVFEGLIFN